MSDNLEYSSKENKQNHVSGMIENSISLLNIANELKDKNNEAQIAALSALAYASLAQATAISNALSMMISIQTFGNAFNAMSSSKNEEFDSSLERLGPWLNVVAQFASGEFEDE